MEMLHKTRDMRHSELKDNEYKHNEDQSVSGANPADLQRVTVTKIPDDDQSVVMANQPGLQGVDVTKRPSDDQCAAVAKRSRLSEDKKDYELTDYEYKYHETNASLNQLMLQKEEMIQSYYEEINKMQQSAHDYFEKIYLGHEKVRLHLEEQKKELENLEMELHANNDSGRQKIEHEKKMNERATLAQTKADEKLLQLAKEQKKEKKKLHERVIELQRKLDVKHSLELEIEHMKCALRVMKHMEEDEDVDVQRKMKAIELDLKSKEEDLEAMEELGQDLI